jgi:molybdopterin converting factor small subunit
VALGGFSVTVIALFVLFSYDRFKQNDVENFRRSQKPLGPRTAGEYKSAMTVLYFSTAKAASGCASEDWEASGPMDERAFWTEAVRRHPELRKIQAGCRVAINETYPEEGWLIAPKDVVAVIPPVSGG